MARTHIELSEAIGSLREQLEVATHAGAASALELVVESLELTVEVGVEREADGKIGWSVLGIGAQRTSSTTQKLVLAFRPRWRGKQPASATDFAIADHEAGTSSIGKVPS